MHAAPNRHQFGNTMQSRCVIPQGKRNPGDLAGPPGLVRAFR